MIPIAAMIAAALAAQQFDPSWPAAAPAAQATQAGSAAAPASEAPSEEGKAVLAYWGNVRTGNAILRVNRPDAAASARAAIASDGGPGWQSFWIGNEPGYGAAQCVTRGEGPAKRHYFFVAHGLSSPMAAWQAALAKAKNFARVGGPGTGYPIACSYPTWFVRGVIGSARETSVVGYAKAQVRKLVTCEPDRSSQFARAEIAPIRPGAVRARTRPAPADPSGCAPKREKDGMKGVRN